MKLIVLCILATCVALTQCFRLQRDQIPGIFSSRTPTALKDAKIPIINWIVQKLDHFNATDERTWQQRYYVNEQYYSPGGPIFVMVSLEGPADDEWLRGGLMAEYALFFGGKLFLMEQRYYGESKPTEDTSIENMQYFTPDQSIADLSYLVQAIGVSHPGAKVVVFGGSFAGNLAAWARLKYPEFINAAVVSSAPLLARFNYLEYQEEVGRVMKLGSQQCYDDMEAAMIELNVVLREPSGPATVTQLFGLCTDLDPDNVMDMMTFQTAFADIYASVAQTATSIQTVQNDCDRMTNPLYGATPFDRLVENFRRFFHPDPNVCYETTYMPYVEAFTNTSWESPANSQGLRPYYYTTCSMFADFASSESTNQPFGNAFPVSVFVQLCMDFFGAGFDAEYIQAAVIRTNRLYGGLQPQITNAVFTQGSFDPWRVLGIQQDLSASATAIVIEEASHFNFLFTADANDSPQLIAARLQARDLVATWIQ